MGGPLEGVRVIEVAGLGPAPFGAMVLADLGADVVTIDRASNAMGAELSTAAGNVYGRGRRSVGVDLKAAAGVEVVRRLAGSADVFVEGFRPGVAERLGLGPDELTTRNPRLVYTRMTGWGQYGPMAAKAGHDINYVALAGPLAHIGRVGQPPTVPLNLIGDFGGGGLLMAMGVCAALVERATSGRGQVLDVAMVDGAALLSAAMAPAYIGGYFSEERGTNLLDSGAPFYDCYETADGRWLSVGALEPQFYADLLTGLGLGDAAAWPEGSVPDRDDQSSWPELRERFTALFASRSLEDWLVSFADLDACVAPVLPFSAVAADPHLAARGTWVDVDGVVQPSPAPRFDRTPAVLDRPPAPAGHHTDEVLAEAGFTAGEIADLHRSAAIA
jgi:alpha-methylacyl-CoA racemase